MGQGREKRQGHKMRQGGILGLEQAKQEMVWRQEGVRKGIRQGVGQVQVEGQVQGVGQVQMLGQAGVEDCGKVQQRYSFNFTQLDSHSVHLKKQL